MSGNLFSGDFITSGSDMLKEFMDRKHGYEQEAQQKPNTQDNAAPPAQQQDSSELAALRQQIAETQRLNGELQGRLGSYERDNVAMRQWIQSQSQQAQPARQEQQRIPNIAEGVDDPLIAAALNTLQSRVETTLAAAQQEINQTAFAQSANNEMGRIRDALAKVSTEFPEFRQYVSDDQLNDFIRPYVNDQRRHGQINWETEFKNVYRNFDYPAQQAKLQELARKLEQYESRDKREKQSQQRDLNKVPGASGGARSGGGSGGSGVAVGDRILNGYRAKHGRRAIMPWDQYSQALFSELAKQGQ